MEDDGIVLLGSPIGSEEYERKVIGEKMEKVREISSLLPLIEDPQIEYALLRSCLSLPKLAYTLRTSNPVHHLGLWQEYDRITRDTLCRILGSSISDYQWWQATLPVSAGGLGLRAAEDHCQAAYITSLIASQDLKQMILGRSAEECPTLVTAAMLQSLAAKTGQEETLVCLQGSMQREVSTRIDTNNNLLFLTHTNERGSIRDRARINSLGLPNSGAWLNVLPSPSLGLQLKSAEFTVCVKYRLGLQIFPYEGVCVACPAPSDTRGDHAVSCGCGGERTYRHNSIRDCLYTTCAQACLGPTREDRALIPGTEARPADIYIPAWSGGLDTAFDITVINPLQQNLLNRSAANPGHALQFAHDRKMTKHGEACRTANIAFVPLPLDTFGAWGDSTVREVKRMGTALARHTGNEDSETIRHLIQRVSVTLMKVNANLILNRSPNNNPTNIDGIE